jgi:hypothetical protein
VNSYGLGDDARALLMHLQGRHRAGRDRSGCCHPRGRVFALDSGDAHGGRMLPGIGETLFASLEFLGRFGRHTTELVEPLPAPTAQYSVKDDQTVAHEASNLTGAFSIVALLILNRLCRLDEIPLRAYVRPLITRLV